MSATSRPARWWELAWDQQHHVAQGTLAYVQGTTQTITCPRCGRYPVVYNGNYFCENYPPLDQASTAGHCDWALAHPARSKRDREFCDLVGLDYS